MAPGTTMTFSANGLCPFCQQETVVYRTTPQGVSFHCTQCTFHGANRGRKPRDGRKGYQHPKQRMGMSGGERGV